MNIDLKCLETKKCSREKFIKFCMREEFSISVVCSIAVYVAYAI